MTAPEAFLADLGALIGAGWIISFSDVPPPADPAHPSHTVAVSIFHDVHCPVCRAHTGSTLLALGDVLRLAVLDQARTEEASRAYDRSAQ